MIPGLKRCLVILALILPSLCACAAEPVPDERATRDEDPARSDLKIAFTFDDVPFVARRFRNDCDAAEMLSLNRRLLDAIRAQKIPATGLVVASRACGPSADQLLTQILGRWLDEGYALGNHTYSHRDFNTVSLDWYVNDIKRGTEVLEPLLKEHGQERRWFRHPLLHAGDTPSKKRGLEEFLSENGYTVAPVTIDNQEWVFAAVYEAALEAGDEELARRVGTGFVEHIEENLVYYEELSEQVFGRQIPQVILLHSNLMNIDWIDELVPMVRERGYELIPLDEAVPDPAYESEDNYVGRRGLSWLQRWALTRGIEPGPEPREPRWIAEKMEEIR